MSESRFLKLVIIALLVLNMGTLGYLWFGQPPAARHFGPEGPPRRGDAAQMINRELGLSEEQETRYKRLRDRHHATVVQIREEMRDYEKQLYRLQREPDQAAVAGQQAAWLDSLAAAQRRIEQITYSHFTDLRALCNPKQQQRLDEVIGDALDRIR